MLPKECFLLSEPAQPKMMIMQWLIYMDKFWALAPTPSAFFFSFSCSCQENSAKIIGWISSSNFVVGAPSGKPWICHGYHPYVVPLIPYSVQVHARVHTSLINLDLKHDQFPHKMMA